LPPDIHIFTASKQPWVVLPPGTPAVPEYYEREGYWPAASLARRQALLPQIQAYQAARRGGQLRDPAEEPSGVVGGLHGRTLNAVQFGFCATAPLGAVLPPLGAGLPLVGVNHLEGHLFSAYLRESGEPPLPVTYPFHGLVVSGGHAELVRVEVGAFVAIARTREDAPGEAFDKIARRTGLGYPGGPIVDRIAARGRADRHPFAIGRTNDGSRDFSFSGLKTAMLRELEKRGIDGSPLDPEALPADLVDLLASFQHAIVAALLDRVDSVYRDEGMRAIALSGGVAANSELRAALAAWGARCGVPVHLPERSFTTDNAAMIGWAGLLRFRRDGAQDLTEANARSRWPLGT
jgi:glycoprotease/Kae1 family metallohydrolase